MQNFQPGQGAAKTSEHVFHQDEGVYISSSRAVVFGTTYALANITSVRSWTVDKAVLPLLLAILFTLFGGWLVVASSTTNALGYMSLAVGVLCAVYYFVVSKKMYHVKIGTAGGEVDALRSKDANYTNQIVAAMNNAIIHRG